MIYDLSMSRTDDKIAFIDDTFDFVSFKRKINDPVSSTKSNKKNVGTIIEIYIYIVRYYIKMFFPPNVQQFNKNT